VALRREILSRVADRRILQVEDTSERARCVVHQEILKPQVTMNQPLYAAYLSLIVP